MAAGKRSRPKGKQGERELCKILAEIFGGSFLRVPNSGAFIGGKNVARRDLISEGQARNAKGDIIPPDFLPKLVLESKWYKDFRFHTLLKPGPVPLLEDWIEQTLQVCGPGDLHFVCFKINGRGWWVAAPRGGDPFEVGNHCVYHSKFGKYLVTELVPFFTANESYIRERCA